jgi:ribosomal protein S18 acetylase RimI-like enzyme
MADSTDPGRFMPLTHPPRMLFDLRPAGPKDVPGIVSVHMASFQQFFLTFLGPGFLARLYLEILREPGAVFLVATEGGGRVVGFAAGVSDLPAFYQRAARTKWFTFGMASVRAAIFHPSIIPRLWRALRASDHAKGASCPASLMSIAVAPETKGAGVGKNLIAGFLEQMGRQGQSRVCLVTDRDNNTATLGFYEGLGFQKTREFQTREGRWVCEYMIDCH